MCHLPFHIKIGPSIFYYLELDYYRSTFIISIDVQIPLKNLCSLRCNAHVNKPFCLSCKTSLKAMSLELNKDVNQAQMMVLFFQRDPPVFSLLCSLSFLRRDRKKWQPAVCYYPCALPPFLHPQPPHHCQDLKAISCAHLSREINSPSRAPSVCQSNTLAPHQLQPSQTARMCTFSLPSYYPFFPPFRPPPFWALDQGNQGIRCVCLYISTLPTIIAS